MTRLIAATLLVALAGCATGPADPDHRPTAQERARDLTRPGSINNRTGMAVPTALCSRSARVISAWLPSARTLSTACSSASRL